MTTTKTLPPSATATVKEWAEFYLAHSLRPFPIWPLTPAGQCTCGLGEKCDRPGKHSGIPWGGKENPLTIEQIDAEFDQWFKPIAQGEKGVALSVGRDLFIVEADVKEGDHGWESLRSNFQADYGAFPETVEWRSGSGGPVYAFKVPHNVVLSNNVQSFGAAYPDIDTRGDGGMVVVPPSRHKRGGRYQRVPGKFFGERDLAPMPIWMVALLARPADEEKTRANGNAPALPASEDHEFSVPVQYGLHILAEAGGARDDSGWKFALYLKDTLRDDQEGARRYMEQWWHEAIKRYPKRSEAAYTLVKALDQVKRAFSQPRREPATFAWQLGGKGKGKIEPAAVRIEEQLASDVIMKPLLWLWPGYIPLGKATLFEGSPDKGKSTVTLDFIARVTNGWAFPDGQVGDLQWPAHAVLMSCEDDRQDTIVPRLVVAEADLKRVHLLGHVELTDGTTRLPSIPEDIELLREIILRSDAKLVVIDPLVGYLTRKVSINDDAEVRHTLEPLHRLAAETGASIIAIRHYKKDRAETDPLSRGGGSIGITAVARAGLGVGVDPDNPKRRLLGTSKHNLVSDDSAPTQAYELVGSDLDIGGRLCSLSRVVWVGTDSRTLTQVLEAASASPSSTDAKSRAREAFEFLEEQLADGEEHKAKDVQEAADAYGISKDTLHKARYKWRKSGRLLTKKHGGGDGEAGYWTWQMNEVFDILDDGDDEK